MKEYCKAEKLNIDAGRFWTYYQSLGWPLKDWKARAQYWAATQKGKATYTPPAALPPTPVGYMRDQYGNLYHNSSGDIVVSDPLADLAAMGG